MKQNIVLFHLGVALGIGAVGAGRAKAASTWLLPPPKTPDMPVIVGPPAGAYLSTGQPLISGTFTPSNTNEVLVYIDSSSSRPLSADLDFNRGTWSVVPPSPLDPGPHAVSAQAAGSGNSVSDPTDPWPFFVDPTPPDVSAPTEGSYLNHLPVAFSGTALEHSSIRLRLEWDGGSVAACDPSADPDGGAWLPTDGGTWACDSGPLSLPDDVYTAYVEQLDEAGNQGPSSVPRTFTIKTRPPSVPVVLNPINGRILNNPAPSASGTSDDGTVVDVLFDGVDLGDVPVEDGGWSYPPDGGSAGWQLAEGSHTVMAIARDPAGNSTASAPTQFFVKLTAPTVDSPVPLSYVTPARLMFNGTARSGYGVALHLYSGDVSDGRCSAGLELQGSPVTAIRAGATWSLPAPPALLSNGDGLYAVQAIATLGTASQGSDLVCFTLDGTAPAAPVVTSPDAGSFTNRTDVVLRGTAEPSTTVTVLADGALVGSAGAEEGSGAWSLVAPLSEGPHALQAQARDRAGNVGPPTAPLQLTVKTAPPELHIVSGPEGAIHIPAAEFEFSSDEDDVELTCGVDADTGNGVSAGPCTSPFLISGLKDGSYTFFVEARDPAGNVTTRSRSWLVQLAEDSHLQGGGWGCAAAGGGPGALALWLVAAALARGGCFARVGRGSGRERT